MPSPSTRMLTAPNFRWLIAETLVIVLGSLIYVIEGEENGFTSIPRSVYWAIVTLTTVGYGDVEGWGWYHRDDNPVGTLLPQQITEFANSAICAGVRSPSQRSTTAPPTAPASASSGPGR